MFATEPHDQPLRFPLNRRHGEVDDVAGFVFEFDRQGIRVEHPLCVGERFQQFARVDTVIDVVAHPRLQQAGYRAAHRAAAIDKIPLNPPHLGDMEVSLNGVAVRPEHGQR